MNFNSLFDEDELDEKDRFIDDNKNNNFQPTNLLDSSSNWFRL